MTDNSFGKLFSFTSFGESHGTAIGCVVDGAPPNLLLNEGLIQPYLDRRRPGTSKFVTQRQEDDEEIRHEKVRANCKAKDFA